MQTTNREMYIYFELQAADWSSEVKSLGSCAEYVTNFSTVGEWSLAACGRAARPYSPKIVLNLAKNERIDDGPSFRSFRRIAEWLNWDRFGFHFNGKSFIRKDRWTAREMFRVVFSFICISLIFAVHWNANERLIDTVRFYWDCGLSSICVPSYDVYKYVVCVACSGHDAHGRFANCGRRACLCSVHSRKIYISNCSFEWQAAGGPGNQFSIYIFLRSLHSLVWRGRKSVLLHKGDNGSCCPCIGGSVTHIFSGKELCVVELDATFNRHLTDWQCLPKRFSIFDSHCHKLRSEKINLTCELRARNIIEVHFGGLQYQGDNQAKNVNQDESLQIVFHYIEVVVQKKYGWKWFVTISFRNRIVAFLQSKIPIYVLSPPSHSLIYVCFA